MADEKKEKILITAFFIIYILIGLCIFKDYGISWDEPLRREHGLVTMNYIIKGDRTLFETSHTHGTVFEVFLISIEKILHLKSPRIIFLMRHLVNFLVFYTGILFFYFLCKETFRSRKQAF